LKETEHDALVLRFFDGKELKHIGASMGISEDAARMRVNRGLEKLREFFSRKGIALSATGIAGAVSCHSVQAAPADLAGNIVASVFSGSALTSSAVITATKTVAMTTLQKTVLTVAMVAAVGLTLYETRRSSQLSAALATLKQARTSQASTQQPEPVVTQPITTLANLPAGESDLLRLRGQIAALRTQLSEQSTGLALNQWVSSVRPLGQSDFADSFNTLYASACTNAGTATPGALLQTWLWALRTSNPEGLLATWDFPANTTEEEKLKIITNQKPGTGDFEEYTLSTLLPLGNDFFLALLTVDGNKLGRTFAHTTKQYFRRVDGSWKITNYVPQIFQQQ